MIETQFFILDGQQYQEFYTEAQKEGVSLDYWLLEFADVEGPYVYVD